MKFHLGVVFLSSQICIALNFLLWYWGDVGIIVRGLVQYFGHRLYFSPILVANDVIPPISQNNVAKQTVLIFQIMCS